MHRLTVPIGLFVTGVLLLVVALTTYVSSRNDTTDLGTSGTAATTTGNPLTQLGGGSLTKAIATAQKRVADVPGDFQTWAGLGAAYVQQARVTGDPTLYGKAEGALTRSLALNSATNWQAVVGMGSLANARHEFRQALSWGRKAVAIDAYNSNAYGVIDDALTQLGDYAGATASVQKMLDLRPGISSFTRASYESEEHGDVVGARTALLSALELASDPADIAFCHYYLGELNFNEGHPAEALREYAAGLVADSAYDPLIAGKAKAEAALGMTAEALRDYADAIARVPQPQYVLEYGELLESLLRTSDADRQFKLLGVEQALFAANGVVDDLGASVVAADHGAAAIAVQHARAEWGRRHSVIVADALAWALHRAGSDKEALTYAQMATRLGWRNATFYYHRGMIEFALGQRALARTDLSMAIKINPYFSILQSEVARATLKQLAA